MPRSTKRASTADLDTLHRLTVKSLVAEIRRLKREKQPVPPALLTASIKLLSVTGSTDPERPAKRNDRLAGLLKEFNETENSNTAEGGVPDFNVGRIDLPARDFPDEG